MYIIGKMFLIFNPFSVIKFNLMGASIRGLQNFFVFQKQKCDNQRFHKLLPFKEKV
jgi:hypothetical protein